MNQEILHEALSLTCDKTFDNVSRPFQVDDYVYATDRKTLLGIPSSWVAIDCHRDYVTPNVKAILGKPRKRVGCIYTRDMPRPTDSRQFATIKGNMYDYGKYTNLRDVSLLLGINGWEVFETGNGLTVMQCREVTFLVIPTMCLTIEENVIDIPVHEEYLSPAFDEESGLLYLAERRARIEAAKAEFNRKLGEKRKNRYGKIFCVNLVKTESVYIEAESRGDAMNLAEKYLSEGIIRDADLDFDDGIEVDTCDSTPSDPAKYMRRIYTEGGVFTPEDYQIEP